MTMLEQHLLDGKIVSKDELLLLLARCEGRLSDNPTSAVFWQQRSYYLVRLGRYQDAINSYQKTLALLGNDAKVWCNYASTLAAAGHLNEAIVAYDRSLDLVPTYSNAWRRRGKILYRLGDYAQAIESYDQALASAPTDGRLWYAKGLASYHLHQIEQAIDYFQIALANNPESREPALALVHTLIKVRRYEEASHHLQCLLSRGWSNAYLYNCYAYLLKQQGNMQGALAQLKQAVCLDPKNASLWFRTGLAWARLGQYAEAHEAFREALKRQAYHANGWLALGIVLRKLSAFEDAIVAFDKALAITPDHPLAFFQQACCYATLGNDSWATEHLKRAIALDAKTYLFKAQKEPMLEPCLRNLRSIHIGSEAVA